MKASTGRGRPLGLSPPLESTPRMATVEKFDCIWPALCPGIPSTAAAAAAPLMSGPLSLVQDCWTFWPRSLISLLRTIGKRTETSQVWSQAQFFQFAFCKEKNSLASKEQINDKETLHILSICIFSFIPTSNFHVSVSDP